MQAASRKLDGDRAQLEEWGSRLAALTKEFDEAKAEVKSARTEIQEQRGSLASQAAALCAAQEQLEIQRQAILDARVDLDR
jgi:predicted  nucleic acid-binding Zn-ribbon protein